MSEVIGRDSELAAGERFLDAAENAFTVLTFEGEAGIGKTTVWAEVAERARRRGFRVLSCRPAATETRLSLSALADLLAPVPNGDLDALPAPQRHALDVALLRVDPGDAPADRRALATGVRSLLSALSGETPLVIAVDDVQWLDADSAAVVEFVLRRLDPDERIGFLLARRIGEATRLELERIVDAAVLSRARIGPMTLGAMHHLLERQGETPSRSKLVRIHEVSGGNPLFALEITRALGASEATRPGAPLPVPDDLRQLLATRIAALSDDAREALLAAAALSGPTTSIVAEASSAAALEAAEESGLVRVVDDRITFAHPLYASAVYGAAAQKRRRAMHNRLAQLVPSVEEQALHLALATPGRKDATVSSRLEDAATVARARGAWESAAELLEQAAAFTPDSRREEAQRRILLAAEHYVRGGDLSRARTLLQEAVAASLPRPLHAEALRLLGEISYNVDSYMEGKRIYTEALEYADDPRQRVLIELGIAYVSVASWLDFEDSVRHAHHALEIAESLGDSLLIGEALALSAIAEFHAGRGVDWDKVERAIALEDRDWLFPHDWRASYLAVILLIYSLRLPEARDRLLSVRAEVLERGDEAAVAWIVWWLAILEAASGNLEIAAAYVDESETLSRLTNSRTTLGVALAVRSFILALKGDAEEVRRASAEALEFARQVGLVTPLGAIALALGWLELSLGDHEAAWRACELPTVAFEYLGITEPSLGFFLPEALEAMIALGHLDRAEKLIDQLESRSREMGRTWILSVALRCRGLLLAARGDLNAAITTMEESLATFEGFDAPPYLARTLLAQGLVLRRARRRTQAKRSFEEALRLFESMGAKLWARRARQELERVGIRRPAGDEMTETERRVAELAAAGKSNREIGEALFISPKTVEANLAHVYRKLGIRSRAELGARMTRPLQT